MTHGKKIALAVVATAKLSGAQLNYQRRLRRLQRDNIIVTVSNRPSEDVPDMMETQLPDSSLSYNLDGGVDLSPTFPMLPNLEDDNTDTMSHSIQDHTLVHISTSKDVENEIDVAVPDIEADATISGSLNETHYGSSHGAFDVVRRNGKSSKSSKGKSKKSSTGTHSGKPSHITPMNEWWQDGGPITEGKTGKASHSPSSKHTLENNASYNWQWNPEGKATKLFKSKSSGWWSPHPNPSKFPTTTKPTIPSFPPLVWEGVNGCTFENPCGICVGDCDSQEDCMPGLECFKRSGSEQVPGCTPGGIGDIPGADYCYDPTQPPTSPTISPIPPTPSPSGTPLPALQWKGVNGCTPSSPCDTCSGDCDDNGGCSGGYECFKRSDGEYTQVPGCAVGGLGDIAGADYCYDPSSVTPPSASPTTLPPQTNPPETGAPTRSLEAFFIQSQAESPSSTTIAFARTRASDGSRKLQQSSMHSGWCAGGALAPDYYQLLLEECKPNTSSIPVGKVEQMDQLWGIDSYGFIRSIFNGDRCMMVSSYSVQFESPIEIGPCNLDGVLNQFYYQTSTIPYTLKPKGEEYASLCVTFLGEEPSRGAELVLGPCENETKFGWDLIPEGTLGKPTMAPTVSMPQLKYLGRDACTPDNPCDFCSGDCDIDQDCIEGLQCFQRERGDSTQVPGCAIGGAGDIPGADYCYVTRSPSISPTPSSQLPPLEWRGSRGCSVDMPCPICTGDCNTEEDCRGFLSCFKRDISEDVQVPGCAVGGVGDIPGGDYCYDTNRRVNSESVPPNHEESPTQPDPVPPTRPVPRPPQAVSEPNINNASSQYPNQESQTANSLPNNPTKPEISLNDDTDTIAQTPPGSKSSKSSKSAPKKLSTNK